MTYLRNFSETLQNTPQNEPMRDDQVQNNAGGYVWAIDDWKRLERFLILGSEGGTYYQSEKDITRQNYDAVLRCIKDDGVRTVNTAVDVSNSGRAPKNDPALFVLALAISHGDLATKQAVVEFLPRAARTGTHLSHFVDYATQFRGWGTTMRRAVANWYLNQPPEKILFHAIKYQSRDGWSQRDFLRLAHPKTLPGSPKDDVFRYIAKDRVSDDYLLGAKPNLFDQVIAINSLIGMTNIDQVCQLVEEYRIPRECVPTELLKEPKVWRSLLKDMPLGALVRNIATMTRNGALNDGQYELIDRIRDQLQDSGRIKRARLHPLAFLVALNTYQSGRSIRGSGNWQPIAKLCDALDDAFYLAFDNVVPIGNRVLLGVDVSGSMSSGTIAGLPGVTPRAAACALAMQIARSEKHAMIHGFSGKFVSLDISVKDRLDRVVKYTDGLPFENTDCAVPMLWAMQNNVSVDTFIIITDNETWAGSVHPKQALDKYRAKMVPGAKLAVIGVTSSGFSIADPNDAGMLDFVGMDTAVPNLIADFAGNSHITNLASEED